MGEFIADRHGKKWVYAARESAAIRAKYPDSVVITPKAQRQLQIDYAKEWGREYDPVFWQMLCALRSATQQLDYCGFDDATKQEIEYAIEEATNP